MSSFERFQSPSFDWTQAEDSRQLPADSAIEARQVGSAQLCENPTIADDHDPRIATVIAAIEAIEQSRRPAGYTEARWIALLAGMRSFAAQWLDIALGCGWELHELFGVPPSGGRRYSLLGALPCANGRAIVSVDANRIIIADQDGSPSSFYRHAPGVSVAFDRSRARLVWDAIREDAEGGARW